MGGRERETARETGERSNYHEPKELISSLSSDSEDERGRGQPVPGTSYSQNKGNRRRALHRGHAGGKDVTNIQSRHLTELSMDAFV